MIKKPNIPSFSPLVVLLVFLFILLVVLFAYALNYHRDFFWIICVLVSMAGIYFVALRRMFRAIKANHELACQDLLEKRNLLEVEIRQEADVVDSIHKKILNYSQLKGVTERLGMCLSVQDTTQAICREVNRLFNHGDMTVILYEFHSKTGELGIAFSHRNQMQIHLKSKRGDLFDTWTVKTLQPLLVENTRSDFRFDMEKIASEENHPVGSLVSVPLVVGHKVLGILRVDVPQENHFTIEELRFLTTVGGLGAVALENAQLYDHVKNLAVRDSLTGLYLRRYLLERITEEINRQLRHKGEMSFLMIDLDEFKQYNDRFGHTAGDIVLRAIANILNETFPEPGNVICRYGGEEFCVLLPDCPKSRAIQLAEALRKKIEWQQIMLRRQKTNVTASVGVAGFPKDAQFKEELIARADAALLLAKQAGRNQVKAA